MTDLRTAAQQALEALEIGYDSARDEADEYHRRMAGYRPERHAAMDADVRKIAAAMTALRAALAEPQEPVAHLWQHSETGRTRIVMPGEIITVDDSWSVVGPLYLLPQRPAPCAKHCEATAFEIEIRNLKARIAEGIEGPISRAVAAEREACIRIVEEYQIPVGNSPAGELACDWTYAALKEIREEIRARSKK